MNALQSRDLRARRQPSARYWIKGARLVDAALERLLPPPTHFPRSIHQARFARYCRMRSASTITRAIPACTMARAQSMQGVTSHKSCSPEAPCPPRRIVDAVAFRVLNPEILLRARQSLRNSVPNPARKAVVACGTGFRAPGRQSRTQSGSLDLCCAMQGSGTHPGNTRASRELVLLGSSFCPLYLGYVQSHVL